MPQVPEYYDLNMRFNQAALYLVEINWTGPGTELKEKFKLYVVPKVHDLQLRDSESEVNVIGAVGDMVRVTLDENPTTGFITMDNALKQENKSLLDKSLSPLEEHVVQLNSYY